MNKTTMDQPVPSFETEPCGRCGGGGMYGPLSVKAGRCFGCGGSGTRFSKRGAAAVEFYRASLPTKRAEDLQVGDRFRASIQDRWATVTAVRPSPSRGTTEVSYVDVEHTPIIGAFGKLTRQGLVTTTVVTLNPGREEVIRLRQAALDYQATLTKTGKPAKRRATARQEVTSDPA